MQVVIVDEFTGRTMADRRWGEGLHQAVEAKEGLPIQNETITLASITYQVCPDLAAGEQESASETSMPCCPCCMPAGCVLIKHHNPLTSEVAPVLGFKSSALRARGLLLALS